MLEIVEGQISAEIKDNTQGYILHDGWTKNGVHFFAIFECYIKKVSISSYYGVIEEPQIILIDRSPMHHIEADDGENDDSAAADDD